MFRSILVALDGSSSAARALEEAIAIARRDGARLTLISVAAPPRWRVMSPYVVPYPTEEDLLRAAERIVDEAQALVPEEVPVCTVVRSGPAAKAILDRVICGEHDLVVLGSHDRGAVRAFLLGSVSRAVAARCAAQVRIVGEGPEGAGAVSTADRLYSAG